MLETDELIECVRVLQERIGNMQEFDEPGAMTHIEQMCLHAGADHGDIIAVVDYILYNNTQGQFGTQNMILWTVTPYIPRSVTEALLTGIEIGKKIEILSHAREERL